MTYVRSSNIFNSFAFSVVIFVCLSVVQGKICRSSEENLIVIEVSLCYILKHLEDRKAWALHIYYTWRDIILIFKLHRSTQRMPRSSVHSLEIRMTSHPCNKYEQIMLSYFLSVNYNIPRAWLLNRSPVPAMVLKSNRSGLLMV